jgi:hypothetical protein
MAGALFPAVYSAHIGDTPWPSSSGSNNNNNSLATTTTTIAATTTTSSSGANGGGEAEERNCYGLACVELTVLIGAAASFVSYILSELIIWRVDNGAYDTQLAPVPEEQIVEHAHVGDSEDGGGAGGIVVATAAAAGARSSLSRQSSNSNDVFVPSRINFM